MAVQIRGLKNPDHAVEVEANGAMDVWLSSQLDTTNDQVTTVPIRGGLATSQVSVNGTATQIVAANATRRQLDIYNLGTVTLFIGPTNAVTPTTGYPIPANTAMPSDLWSSGAVYGITAGTAVTACAREIS